MLTQLWTKLFALTMPMRLVIGLVLLIVIFMVAQFLVLGPQQEEFMKLSSRAEELKILQDKKIMLQSAIRTQKAEIQKIEKELAGTLEKLPNEKEIPQLLLKASSLGREAGLDVTVFRQKPEVFREFYMEVPVEMSTRTDYHQLQRYFFSLGKMPRIVNVTNMVIGNPKVERNNVSLQASFLITTYRFLSEAEKAAIKKAQAKSK